MERTVLVYPLSPPAVAVPGGVGTHACYQSFKCTPFLGYFYEEHPLFSANLGENHSKKYPLISKIWEVYLMGCYTVCALMFEYHCLPKQVS